MRLQNYIARESIVSALSDPVLLDMEKLKLDSAFQKNMVMHDFRKDVFELFEKKCSDIILIDFIDERFPLARIGHSVVTWSNELMSSGYISKPKLVKMRKQARWPGSVKRDSHDVFKVGRIDAGSIVFKFCQRLLNIYRPEQIILHEVYLSDYYINKEGKLTFFPENHLKNNRETNKKYGYMYRKFKECLPEAHVIDCSREFAADENHKWGLSPMHFQKEYYERVLKEIESIIAMAWKSKDQEKITEDCSQMECRGHLEEGKNKLIFEIAVHNGEAAESFEYAFYIYCNGKRIITRWYEKVREIALSNMQAGVYYAVGFIRKFEKEPEIITSLPVQILPERTIIELPALSVSIFGSCVSRDILEYEAACKVKLDMYFAKQSVISAVSPAIPLSYEDIHLQSNFQRKQVYYDFSKRALNMLQEHISDYLFIDLVDERFSLVKLAGSYVTRSKSLMESGLIDESSGIVEKEEYVDETGNYSYRVDGVDVRKYFDKFCENILQIYEADKIILHVVKGAEFYYDKEGKLKQFEANTIGHFKRLNRMWAFMYDYLHQRLSGCNCIDISEGYFADERHVWGLSPIHFQKEYYENVLQEMNRIVIVKK